MCTNPSWWTPTSDEGAERGDIRHDTFENHAGLQILELLKLAVLKIGRNTDVLPISVFSSLFGCCENASHHGIGFRVYSGGNHRRLGCAGTRPKARKP
jgi:hypothetical protein